MQDLHRRRSYRNQSIRALMGAGGIALLVVLAFFLTRGAWHMYGKFSQAAAAREAGESHLAQLRQEESRAKDGVAELGTARGLEAEVRARYGLARPGEATIVVVRSKDEEAPEAPAVNLFERLWHAIFPW